MTQKNSGSREIRADWSIPIFHTNQEKYLPSDPEFLRDLFEMAPQNRGVINKGHDEMIGDDVVEISRMNQDTFVFEQTRRCSLFITPDRNRDVKTSTRLNERNTLETFDRLVAAGLDPAGRIALESPGRGERFPGTANCAISLTGRKVSEMSSRAERAFRTREGSPTDRHPSNLHSWKCEQLRKSIQCEDQRRIRPGGARKFTDAEKKFTEDFV